MRIQVVVLVMFFWLAAPVVAQEQPAGAPPDAAKPAAEEEPMWLSGWAGWGSVNTSGSHRFNGFDMERFTGVNRASGLAAGFRIKVDPMLALSAGMHRYEGNGSGNATVNTTMYNATFGAGSTTSTNMKWRNLNFGVSFFPESLMLKDLEIGVRAHFWSVNYTISGVDASSAPVADSDSWRAADLTFFMDFPIRTGRTNLGISVELSAIPVNYLFGLVANAPSIDGPNGEEGYGGAFSAFTFRFGMWWEYEISESISVRLMGNMHADVQESYADDYWTNNRETPSWVGGWVAASFTVRF